MSHRIVPLVSLALTLTLAACGGDKPSTEAKTPAPSAAEATPTPPPGDPANHGDVKKIEGDDPSQDRFSLTITPPVETSVGAEGTVKITVVPKAPWHMNLDYPTSLAVNAPKDVTVPKAEQRKDDAVRLDEGQAEFGVAFTAAVAGDKTFTGELKFAVCQDDACAPVTEEIQFKVAVK